MEIIRNIKDNERGGRATIIVVGMSVNKKNVSLSILILELDFSENEKLNQNKKVEQFWEALGDKVRKYP